MKVSKTIAEIMDEEDAKRIAYLNSAEGKADENRLNAKLKMSEKEREELYSCEDEEEDEEEE